jgi:uncharacterized membrane protein YphA (DoxX/SURF4 family)
MLAAARGLALVRIACGLYFLSQVYGKIEQHWFTTADPMTKFIKGNLPHSAHIYKNFLSGTVIPHAGMFSQLVFIGEFVAGISLTLGLFTRVGATVGAILNLNYMLCKGLTQSGGSIDRLFLVGEIVFFVTAAGLVWGLDGALRDATGKLPFLGWLTGSGKNGPQAMPAI